MARSAASPAAASAFCHSESTRAQPSACVVIIYDLHSSYRAIGESVRAPASWPMWRTARGARARAVGGSTLGLVLHALSATSAPTRGLEPICRLLGKRDGGHRCIRRTPP